MHRERGSATMTAEGRAMTRIAPAPEPLLVSPRQAARLLSVSERTLFTWTKAGKIPCVKLGRLVRYSIDSLKEFIAEAEKVVDKIGDKK
jgi:excisionase family DNA binding protein